ncbi:hypothetical protein BU23DRAFT_572570 [Bimuria novae-zelandiae CBS 107.79]|uniref:Uncharacterized protein n=1 Tax=Bimuria novae-zelandiae CBS 107.79 TaxID=1447943 RepID=A0A6A5UWP9_9PLEO|nr:hypothetical protein BU23DRAFT_572570 [Bimuria novae-zelandiae CBS 107.79]
MGASLGGAGRIGTGTLGGCLTIKRQGTMRNYGLTNHHVAVDKEIEEGHGKYNAITPESPVIVAQQRLVSSSDKDNAIFMDKVNDDKAFWEEALAGKHGYLGTKYAAVRQERVKEAQAQVARLDVQLLRLESASRFLGVLASASGRRIVETTPDGQPKTTSQDGRKTNYILNWAIVELTGRSMMNEINLPAVRPQPTTLHDHQLAAY